MTEIAVSEKIEGTSLWVVAVVYHRHQTSLHRCEAGENITVYRVRDEVSGEVGHLSHAQRKALARIGLRKPKVTILAV